MNPRSAVMKSAGDGAVRGRSEHPMRRREATVLVFPSIKTGRAALLVRNHGVEADSVFDAQITLDDDERRRLIELLGGTI